MPRAFIQLLESLLILPAFAGQFAGCGNSLTQRAIFWLRWRTRVGQAPS
jgi:hypothetical protein